jgi:hypothetical protein
MTTAALVTMLCTWAIVTTTVVVLFVKVLRTPSKKQTEE